MRLGSAATAAALVLLALSAPAGPASAAQPNTNFIELAHVDPYAQYNDCWGYRDPNTGREYAILGTTTGISIWNITDPFNPYETGFVRTTGSNSGWRDIDTYGDNIYAVSEGSQTGLQMIDISDPESPDSLGKKHAITSHTLWIDKDAAVAYCMGVGGVPGAAGFRAYSLATPDNPVMLANWGSPYYHDLWAGNGRAYGAAIQSGGHFDILDVSNLPTVTLTAPVTYPDGFTHNAWPSDDGDYVFTTDELLGTGTVRVFDVTNTASVVQVADFPLYTNTCVHNVYVKGDTAYCSWYEEGILAFDVTDPLDPVQIGSFDTGPDTTGPFGGYIGCWAVYPFLPSGVIVTSDILQGMHLVYYADEIGTVSGTVTEEGSLLPLEGVEVSVPDFFNRRVVTDAGGNYTAIVPGGSHMVFASKSGYGTESANVLVTDGGVTDQDFVMSQDPTGVGTSAPVSGLVRLSPAAPNPSRGATTLALDVPRPTDLTLVVFDASGRRVRTLAAGPFPQGRHAVDWDGRDDAGRALPSGAFFARLVAGDSQQSTKILLTR
jgi:choice-of-anchor B domain-containing protein